MWKVIWNYRGRFDLGGEKTFNSNHAAQSFANYMIRKGGITQTKVEKV